MKNTKRSMRRHHRRRMIARARRLLRIGDRQTTEFARRGEDDIVLRALYNHNHLAACACRMCNRPRKWHGLTVQERRFDQKTKYAEG